MSTISYPIVDGIWYPYHGVPEELAGHMTADAEWLDWAHRQAGWVLLRELQHPGIMPEYLYPDGYMRPALPRALLRGKCREIHPLRLFLLTSTAEPTYR